MQTVIYGLAVLAVMGAAFGAILGLAAKVFAVQKDPKEEAILECLPGANCGGCGYPGCSGYAAAVASGKAPVNACAVGEGPVAAQIAQIMGVENVSVVRKEAVVHCTGCGVDHTKYNYQGIQDCKSASLLPGGGPLSCDYGCLGLGTCEKACPFDAIHVKDGVAVVDHDKCMACGKCVDVCPRHIIALEPFKTKKHVSIPCSSKAKGPVVTKVCTNGCIGCGICAKACPKEAITVEDFLAKIDYDKCVGCGICASKCPRHLITVDDQPSTFQPVPPKTEKQEIPTPKVATETPAPAMTEETLATEVAKAEGKPEGFVEPPAEEKVTSSEEAFKVLEETVDSAIQTLKSEEEPATEEDTSKAE